MQLSKYKPEQRVFALFIGRTGDGKSSAAASFPGPLEIHDFDMRIAGVAGVTVNKGGWVDDNGISFEQHLPLHGFEKFDAAMSKYENLRVSGQFNLKTIQIDSLGSMARAIVATALKYNTKSMKIGSIQLTSGNDFKFEHQATHHVFDFLRGFPCNVICTAHVIERWGKDPNGTEYSPNVVLGERLNVRDQLGESVGAYFDNVWRFSREVENRRLKYTVEFANDLAKNSYGILPGKFDITGTHFYNFFQQLLTMPEKTPSAWVKLKQQQTAKA